MIDKVYTMGMTQSNLREEKSYLKDDVILKFSTGLNDDSLALLFILKFDFGIACDFIVYRNRRTEM